MLKILVTEPEVYCQECLSILSELGILDVRGLSRAELLESVSPYHILMVGLDSVVDKELLEKAGALKIIGSPTTGLDHIDTLYAGQEGIEVVSLKGEREFLENVVATVEHTFALLLSLIRNIPWAFDSIRDERWTRNRFFGTELSGKMLGIIGFGRVGSKVSRIASAFGMKAIACDPYADTGTVKYVDLETLLGESDVISIHVALTAETEDMIGYREFGLMRRKPFLINTARGKVINEDALLQALETGQIAGAAIDVLSDEITSNNPLKDNLLVSYARRNNNLIITPHLGGGTYESMRMTQIYIAEKVTETANRLLL